jgi:hypothetical protein
MTIVAGGTHEALHLATSRIMKHGQHVGGVESPNSVGSRFGTMVRPSREILGLSLEITNPRDRVMPSGCAPFHVGYATANFLWSIRRNARASEILAYNSGGSSLLGPGGEFQCGVPSRLVGAGQGLNALSAAVALLRRDANTRRALIPFITAEDLDAEPRDFPCMSSLHLLIRESKLHAITHMRSQALLSIFPYDIFLFTMIQEAVANLLGLGLGSYYHICNSLHIYDEEAVKERAVAACTAKVLPMDPMTGESPLVRRDLVVSEMQLRSAPAAKPMFDDSYWGPLFDEMEAALNFTRRRSEAVG